MYRKKIISRSLRLILYTVNSGFTWNVRDFIRTIIFSKDQPFSLSLSSSLCVISINQSINQPKLLITMRRILSIVSIGVNVESRKNDCTVIYGENKYLASNFELNWTREERGFLRCVVAAARAINLHERARAGPSDRIKFD